MARKTLLTEGEIRQFMKLANLPAIGSGRLEEMAPDLKEQFPDEEEEAEEMPLDMGAEEEAPLDDLGPVDDAEMEMGDDPGDLDVGGTDEASVEELVQALADTIADVTGVPVSVEGGEGEVEPAPEDEAPEDMELDADLGAEEPDLDVGEELPPEPEEEVPGMRDVYENKEDVVNEVARRVVARLTQEKQNDDLANQLAERILKRITSTK